MPTSARPDRTHCSKLRTRELCLAFVLVAVVWAQALGFMHRITHAFHDAAGVHQSSAGAMAVGHARGADPVRGNWLDALFEQHQAESDCRLYEGLSQPVFALAQLAVLPLLPPCTRKLLQWDIGFVAREAALFEARGPPLAF